ncbi:MAG: hypothetical protein D6731_13380 [Planctomycetota bacterium]|nr:MAG: hypothetical protein D6731_13380 [Planctomycetota bacterium]
MAAHGSPALPRAASWGGTPRRDPWPGSSGRACYTRSSVPRLLRPHAVGLALAAVLGVVLRAAGWNQSLWLDEFGTAWAVDGSLAEAWTRSVTFHGQSPLYYVLVWPFAHFLGPAEASLRLPSLLAGLAGLVPLYGLAKELGGSRAARCALLFALLDPLYFLHDGEARPYALATAFAGGMLYGAVRTARRGSLRDRLLLVGCGLGAFYAHYLLVLPAFGLVLVYALSPAARRSYPPRAALLDLGLAALLAAPGLLHLLAIAARRGELAWLGAPDLFLPWTLLARPALVAAAAGFCARRSGAWPAHAELLPAAAAAPGVLLDLFALAGGPNLLAARYLSTALVPAVAFAALFVARLRRGLAVAVCLAYLGPTLAESLSTYAERGAFDPLQGMEQWREAVEALSAAHAARPGPVLYRSGFVEEDQHPFRPPLPVDFAPLRSPGRPAPPWRTQVVPLLYRWNAPGREDYLARSVAPAVAAAETIYLLSCDNGYGDVPARVRDYVEGVRGRPLRVESLPAEGTLRGVVLWRLSDAPPAPPRASPGRSAGPARGSGPRSTR